MGAKRSNRALRAAFIAACMLNAPLAPAQAECYEKAPVRPVYRTYIRRDVVEPGVYGVYRTPSVYGVAQEKVYEPGEVIVHEQEPVYRTVTREVRKPGGWAWQKCEAPGKEIICRVRLPATYVTVEKQVLVRRGRRWAEHTPPTVGEVHRRILLRPYKNIIDYKRPDVVYSREHLAIYPEDPC